MRRRLCLLLPVLMLLPGIVAGQESFLPDTAACKGFTARIPLRDGKYLGADVVVPRRPGKWPVVLVQTPYNKSLLRPAYTGAGRYGATSLFTDSNYAFVVTDWRGRFESKEAAAGPDSLGQDGYDTIAWIVRQEWSNGKAGTWGPSALGRAQYETARMNPAGLVCSVPMVMPLNLDYDIYFPGGALWEEFARTLGKLGWNLRDQLAAQPVNDARWKALRAGHVKGPDMRVPMLFVGGWFDVYTDGVLAAFHTVRTQGGEKARTHSKLIMGPWLHGTDQLRNGELEFPQAAQFNMKQARAFLDFWLRGAANGFDAKAPITYFQMGASEWRSTSAWPPEGVADRAYYLGDGRLLRESAGESASSPAAFRYDPANPAPTIGGHVLDPTLAAGPRDQREKVESRADVLVFSTEPLASDLPVTGKVRVKLFVSSDRPDTDFTAILTDVYPDGRSMLISEGIQRMRFRNSDAKEEFMRPGEVYPITIGLTNTAITFLKGHRARIVVSSSNYPKYALNLNDGGPMYKPGNGLVAANRVHYGARHPSALILPVGRE